MTIESPIIKEKTTSDPNILFSEKDETLRDSDKNDLEEQLPTEGVVTTERGLIKSE